jgi:hypothetical protein
MECTPPPERLAELIERLAQWLEAQNSFASLLGDSDVFAPEEVAF